jgi:hypothetical protein
MTLNHGTTKNKVKTGLITSKRAQLDFIRAQSTWLTLMLFWQKSCTSKAMTTQTMKTGKFKVRQQLTWYKMRLEDLKFHSMMDAKAKRFLYFILIIRFVQACSVPFPLTVGAHKKRKRIPTWTTHCSSRRCHSIASCSYWYLLWDKRRPQVW